MPQTLGKEEKLFRDAVLFALRFLLGLPFDEGEPAVGFDHREAHLVKTGDSLLPGGIEKLFVGHPFQPQRLFDNLPVPNHQRR